MPYRLGIDIGGTFTDAMLINEETGEIRIGKVSSTPRDPSLGFLEASARILREAAVSPGDVRYVVHGTTVATNAIIEGKLASTGFITTEGFRDLLEIQRQIRPSLYDLQFEKPRPLVPRYLCFGVPERLDWQGNALKPLDTTAARQVALQLKAEGVEAVAVCLLHAYINPAHERQIGAILAEVFPEAIVSLSSDVAPEIREYYRASTTVINAGIRPIVARYLQSIEERLRAMGLSAELLIMQSSGGVFTFAAAREKPVFMVESGPAAGVIAATHLGDTLGFRNILSFDMGGTTAKAGLVEDGRPKVTKEYEVGAAAQSGSGRARGSGYPIRTPVIDLVEIGAGGGSIAWVDSGGALRVGPQSAGADPGPVCYGQGGTEPTITDANLVLGRLNPDYFLGGEIKLDVERARAAIKEKVADRLDMDPIEAAYGIVEIANAAMVNALRLVSVQRGHDPRDFVLIAFGGGGPAHANRLAQTMEVPTTCVPMSPGIFSALGLLVTDLKHDYAATFIQRADRIDAPAIARVFARMEAEGRAELAREGIRPADMAFAHMIDMRYVGQSFELTIPLAAGDAGELNAERVAGLLALFHAEHERAYGHASPGEPVEFVNLRLTAIGRIGKPRLRAVGAADGAAHAKGARSVYFAERGGFSDVPLYDRYALRAGHVVAGPAIIEEFDSTTAVHPGYAAKVDEYGNLLLQKVEVPE
ncbi:MAG: hydantoinase/oxoprolinase family protein [Chloroflexi bacterium]|nr:hydantoinase/oxoprolinase family protein [Chloroflexota bacterium]